MQVSEHQNSYMKLVDNPKIYITGTQKRAKKQNKKQLLFGLHLAKYKKQILRPLIRRSKPHSCIHCNTTPNDQTPFTVQKSSQNRDPKERQLDLTVWRKVHRT